MNIKINSINYKLKYASQLTVKEYIDYMSSLNEKSGNFEQLINYISITTGVEVGDVSNININNDDIRRILSYIGQVKSPEDIKEVDSFYYGRKGRTIYQNKINWRALGYRKLLEEKDNETALEQCVYLLAAYISGDFDIDKIDKIYNDLLKYEFESVFGFVLFFFKKLASGAKQGKTCWLKRKLNATINTLRSSLM